MAKRDNGTGVVRAPAAGRRRGAAARPVAAGDTAATMDAMGFESDAVARKLTRARTIQAQTLSDILASYATGDPAAPPMAELAARMDGVSPDDRKALKRLLTTASGTTTPLTDGDRELAVGWREGGYPYRNLLSRKSYERQKYRLQVELLKLQAWVKETGARVVALEKPSELERGQWYFQRYVQHLPTRGEIVMFDRSWYNRAGVERVMGFCSDAEYEEFMRQAPEFERHLVRSGVHLFKFWFSVSRDEQRRRFKERKLHPLKRWKLSPVDMASLDKWDDYTRAKESMFLHCDTSDAPWTVIKSDCKKRARINAMRYVLHRLSYAKRDLDAIGPVDPLVVGRPSLVPNGSDDPISAGGGS